MCSSILMAAKCSFAGHAVTAPSVLSASGWFRFSLLRQQCREDSHRPFSAQQSPVTSGQAPRSRKKPQVGLCGEHCTWVNAPSRSQVTRVPSAAVGAGVLGLGQKLGILVPGLTFRRPFPPCPRLPPTGGSCADAEENKNRRRNRVSVLRAPCGLAPPASCRCSLPPSDLGVALGRQGGPNHPTTQPPAQQAGQPPATEPTAWQAGAASIRQAALHAGKVQGAASDGTLPLCPPVTHDEGAGLARLPACCCG